jgi:imidazolonepropionase-like amidohydrolase
MTTHRIEAALLIPGRGDPIDGGTVILEDGVVRYAGSAASAPATPDAAVTEVATAMPGLWDCHTHFVGLPAADLEVELKLPTALKAARATADLSRTMSGGVTSAREVGGLGIFLRHAVDEGTIAGPRIYAAGRVLSTTGGHADVHGYPLDWVLSAPDALGEICDGVPECLRAVRKQLRAGAAVIKVCASGGVASELDDPVHQQFSDEELAAIVAEAARAGRSVAAHCHGKAGIMAALRAGVRTIEHGSYLDEEAAELMKRQGAVLVPTRWIIEDLLATLDGLPAYVARKAVAVADRHREALEIAVASGVTIAMGTDIFLTGSGAGTNGREVRYLVEAGMTVLEAITAATVHGPLTLGEQAPRSGRLDEGYDADVIAFDGDPLADLAIWGEPERVTHVWKAGALVKAPAA